MELQGLEMKRVPVADLKPAGYNPRKISESDRVALRTSIETFGLVEPLVMNKTTGSLVAGHQRLEALLALEVSVTDVVIVELSLEQEKALNVALNKISGEWDKDKLRTVLNELDAASRELAGFAKKELKTLLSAVAKPGLTGDDELPAEPEFVCEPGALYQLGEHRVLVGDSRDEDQVARLMNGKRPDMVFTDPPYGIDYTGARSAVLKKKHYGRIAGDKDTDITQLLEPVLKLADGVDTFICLSPVNLKSALALFEWYNGLIVWKKPTPGLGYQWIRRYCEFLFFITKRKKKRGNDSEFDFWEIQTDPRSDYQHGNQKPVALAERALAFSAPPGGLVADLYLGSGSTLIACEKTGRRCYAMEIGEKEAAVAIERWQRFTGKQAERIEHE